MAANLVLCLLHTGRGTFVVFGHHGRSPFPRRAVDLKFRKLRVVYESPIYPRYPRCSARRVAPKGLMLYRFKDRLSFADIVASS